jgi:hypothetical protein
MKVKTKNGSERGKKEKSFPGPGQNLARSRTIQWSWGGG